VSTPDVHGPIDFVLLEFPDQEPTGEVAGALMGLSDAGIIRIYDILAVRKAADGAVSGFEVSQLGGEGDVTFAAFAGARSGLLGDDDIDLAGEVMQPGTIAALIVYENSWAIPFVDAAMKAGGQLVASTRIPAQDVMDALDALETTD
jgi:hypothetical protein